MSEPSGAQIEDAMRRAIESVIADQERGFVIKWVAIVETAGEDGQRGVWTMTSDDTKRWDVMGLLEYGRQLQAAEMVAEQME